MFLQQVLNYGFLSILLSSCIQACPVAMQDGWKQLSLAERTRRADVVAIGKTVRIHPDAKLRDFKTGGFDLLDIFKGHKIIEAIHANTSQSTFYILGFGSHSLCYTQIMKDEIYILFAKLVKGTSSLTVPFDILFGGTAAPTVKNQDEILESLGKNILLNVNISYGIAFSCEKVFSCYVKCKILRKLRIVFMGSSECSITLI